MAYGFNNDKSKQDVYSKSEIDSMLAEIAGNANRLLTPSLDCYAELANEVSVPANTLQLVQLHLPQLKINAIRNNFGDDAKIKVAALTGFQARGTNPSTEARVYNLIISQLIVKHPNTFIAPTTKSIFFEGQVYNPNDYEVTIDDVIAYFNYVVQAS